jgi:hypothetical protein
MNRRLECCCGTAGALLACILAWTSRGQRLNLTARGQVNLYDKPTDGQIIKILKAGESVAVVRCEDLKHYIVPVVLVDGQRAYAQEGSYRMDRKPFWDLGAGPVSMSCP